MNNHLHPIMKLALAPIFSCPVCHGTGKRPGSDYLDCTSCGAAEAIAAANQRGITDTQRLEWLLQNVTYLEHLVDGIHPTKAPVGGWWPVRTDYDLAAHDPDLEGLSLRAYIDAMITREAE